MMKNGGEEDLGSGRPGRAVPRKSYAEGGSEDEDIGLDGSGGGGSHVPSSGAVAGDGGAGGGGHSGSNGIESQSKHLVATGAASGGKIDQDDEDDDDDGPSEYEKERQRNIARNKQLMEKLGLEKAAKKVSPKTPQSSSSGGRTPGQSGKKRKARTSSAKDEEEEWTRPQGGGGGGGGGEGDSDDVDDMIGSDEDDLRERRKSGGGGGGGRQKRTNRRAKAATASGSGAAGGGGTSPSAAVGGSSSSNGVNSGRRGASSSMGSKDKGEAKFNQNEIAYAEMLWPLLDIEEEGHVTLETLQKVISRAIGKGFNHVITEEDSRDMFRMFAKENEVLTAGDVMRIVRDTKMHHKR
jgi:hypothetical protein